MGFFSNLTRSWKKSSELQALQRKIAPPNQKAGDIVAAAMGALEKGGRSEKDIALESFLDLCTSDDGVQSVMKTENLSRSDLKQIYMRLLTAGLGQWINGHYAALSTIAYAEPLCYLARAQKGGVTWVEIVFNLSEYWANKIPQGGLLRQIP